MEKFDRAVGLTRTSGVALLTQVAKALLASDSPCYEHELCLGWTAPECAFEAGLLFRRGTEDGRSIVEFYYERERDFVIAFWARDWAHAMDQPWSSLVQELASVGQSRVGREVLRWFLSKFASEQLLLMILPNLPELAPPLRLAIIEALCQIAAEGERWTPPLEGAIPSSLVSDPDLSVRLAYAKLITIQEDSDELESFFANHYSVDVLRELLEVEEEYPLSEGSAGQIIVRALQSYSWDNADYDESSILADDLDCLLSDDAASVRIGAARAFGTIDPISFFRCAAVRLRSLKRENLDLAKEEISAGIDSAIGELGERYWGSMCPGMLSSGDPEMALEEYQKLKPAVTPLLRLYKGTRLAENLGELLKDVRPETVPGKVNNRSADPRKGPPARGNGADVQPSLFE